MRLLDRVMDRYSTRDVGYYEGMASGASVLFEYSTESGKETIRKDLWTFARQAAATNGVVFSCILARLMLLSEASFKFRSLSDKHLYGNQSLQILEEPWPNGTTGDLWAWMELDVSMGGNAYIWKAAPDLLVRLPPKDVSIISQIVKDDLGRQYRQVVGYDYQPAPPAESGYVAGRPEIPPEHFTPDEIVHWAPIPDPDARFRGMSWLTPIVKEVNADTGLTLYKTKYMEYGTPVTAIKYSQKFRPDTIDAVQERLRKKYGGVGNAWQPLIVDQGADPILGPGLAGLDLRKVQEGTAERIISAAGLYPIILGLSTDNPGMTYEQAMRAFGDRTIRPLWRSGCAALEKVIDDLPAGAQLWYDTTDIAALQDAQTEQAQVVQVKAAATLTLVQAGFTRESVVSAVTANDLSLLEPDPNAPTPGVTGREAIQVMVAEPLTDESMAEDDKLGVQDNNANGTMGKPPLTGQTLRQPQMPASKKPAPNTIPTAPGGPRPNNPSPNK